MKSNKFWIILLAAVLLVCGGVAGFLYYRNTHAAKPTGPNENGVVGPVAVIYLDGQMVNAVDLGKVTETYSIPYTGSSENTNTVEIAPGKIRVHDATCPDQICVSQGWLDETGILPIACLPNSLIIEVSTAADLGLDGVTR